MPGNNFEWDSPTQSGAEFQPTAWTDLRALSSNSDPVRQREALERICRSYWKPIYAFIRRRGYPVESSRDLTQDFFHHLLSKERLRLADQRRGRFRSFVLRALQNFLASDWDRRSAQKRDERVVVSLDDSLDDRGQALEPASLGAGPDQLFDQLWALELLAATRRRLEEALATEGKETLLRLVPMALGEDDTTPYATVAAELQMNEPAVRKAVERLRLRWQNCLREEIALTVRSPEDAEEELRELFAALVR